MSETCLAILIVTLGTPFAIFLTMKWLEKVFDWEPFTFNVDDPDYVDWHRRHKK